MPYLIAPPIAPLIRPRVVENTANHLVLAAESASKSSGATLLEMLVAMAILVEDLAGMMESGEAGAPALVVLGPDRSATRLVQSVPSEPDGLPVHPVAGQ